MRGMPCHSRMWNLNCWMSWPLPVSQTMAVWSTLLVTNRSPLLFHLRLKTGPWWPVNVHFRFPVHGNKADEKRCGGERDCVWGGG